MSALIDAVRGAILDHLSQNKWLPEHSIAEYLLRNYSSEVVDIMTKSLHNTMTTISILDANNIIAFFMLTVRTVCTGNAGLTYVLYVPSTTREKTPKK